MPKTKEQIKEAINELVKQGKKFIIHECLLITSTKTKNDTKKVKTSPKKDDTTEKIEEYFKKSYSDFTNAYQIWYSSASIIIKQLLPDRYEEFTRLYKPPQNRKNIDVSNYTISDNLMGISRFGWSKIDTSGMLYSLLNQQNGILESAINRLDSILSDIEGTLQARLFDDELSAAADLLKKGHLRSAGALTGVTLERHFTTVAQNHALKLIKKNPTISDFNELFKSNGIYDIPTYRFIQRLADIRNIATHFKGREPTKIEIDEMIKGADKILKTVF